MAEKTSDIVAARLQTGDATMSDGRGKIRLECDNETLNDSIEVTTVEYLKLALSEVLPDSEQVQPIQIGMQTEPLGSGELQKQASCGKKWGERCPSVNAVADLFTLNELQGVAFRACAKALLQKIAYGFGLCSSPLGREKPFSMYLGGEGGTGKCRVIDALQYLAKHWDRPGAVITCAPTGIAASIVRGQTFHSVIKLRGGSEYQLNRKPSQVCIAELAGTLMMIVDEISMMSRKHLGALDCFYAVLGGRSTPSSEESYCYSVATSCKSHQLHPSQCT